MQREEIQALFERYFAKYKKRENQDDPNWTAYWTEFTPQGKFEVRMIQSPEQRRFTFFEQDKKIAEVTGWEAFFETSQALDQDPDVGYEEAAFFASLREAMDAP